VQRATTREEGAGKLPEMVSHSLEIAYKPIANILYLTKVLHRIR
jgi:hypothetical protein